MKYASDKHHRHSIRLKHYDYSSPGAYFVTICTQNRECLFGEIVARKMVLNDAGKIVADEWIKTGDIRDEIELDAWVVMPNHFHGIVMIRRGDRPVAPTPTPLPGPRPKSIGSLMSGFKSTVTKCINKIRQTPGISVWQRNYYEHIIRNETELDNIRQYIIDNPLNWQSDENYQF